MPRISLFTARTSHSHSHSYFGAGQGGLTFALSLYGYYAPAAPFCPWNRRVFIFIWCWVPVIRLNYSSFLETWFCRKTLDLFSYSTQWERGVSTGQSSVLSCLCAWQPGRANCEFSRRDAASDFTTVAAAASAAASSLTFGAWCVFAAR